MLIAVEGMKTAPRRPRQTFSEQLAAADRRGPSHLEQERGAATRKHSRPATITRASAVACEPHRSPRPSDEEYLTVAEVRQILRFSDRHVRELIANGEIGAHHFGSAVRIARSTLDNYIEQRRRKPK
ncbi:MAG: helix-turn-helix domain-containing protein [Rhodospirillales bacterium]|nr:helix-turn-helix domain-containing protein [Rhodospirillales bacterium]